MASFCDLCGRVESKCICWTPTGKNCYCLKCRLCDKCLAVSDYEITCDDRCTCEKNEEWTSGTISHVLCRDVADIVCKMAGPPVVNRKRSRDKYAGIYDAEHDQDESDFQGDIEDDFTVNNCREDQTLDDRTLDDYGIYDVYDHTFED